MRGFLINSCLIALTFGLLTVSAQAGGKLKHNWYQGYPVGKPVRFWELPYDDHQKMIICTNRSIPPNWVVVGVRHSVSCNGLGNNSWIIQRLPVSPGAEIIICGNQPVPPGFEVIEQVKSAYCGHGVGGIRIRKM